MLERLDLTRRAKAAGVHLLISGAVAALAAALVFGVWFPGIYRQVAGGRDLFLLVTSVDIVLGPLLTFAVFNMAKGWPHLRRDLAIIAVIQLAALGYGLLTVYEARPVAMVFETDRLRVVSAAQVALSELPKARAEYRTLPLTGPWLLSARVAAQGDESNEALFAALAGVDRAQRPTFWQPYQEGLADILKRARPLSVLLTRYPSLDAPLRKELAALKLDPSSLRFLPLTGRGGDWVAILDGSGLPVHYEPVDGFF